MTDYHTTSSNIITKFKKKQQGISLQFARMDNGSETIILRIIGPKDIVELISGVQNGRYQVDNGVHLTTFGGERVLIFRDAISMSNYIIKHRATVNIVELEEMLRELMERASHLLLTHNIAYKAMMRQGRD